MRREIERARAVGLGTLAAFGLLLAQGRIAVAQTQTGNAGDTTPNARPGSRINTPGGQDAQMLIAHGLEMAIEGSGLQALAMQTGMGAGAPGVSGSGALRPGSADVLPRDRAGATLGSNAGTSTAGTSTGLGSAGTSTGAAGAATGAAGAPATTGTGGVGTTGTGSTGTASGTVPGRPAAIGNGAAPFTSSGFAPGGSGAVTPGESRGVLSGPSAGPGTNGTSIAMLQQHAQQSFEAAERLLNQAGREGGTDSRLQQAATRYAATLRSLGAPRPVGAEVAGSNPPPAGPLGGSDLASIALINHAVKEAIGSLKIHQLIRSPNSADSPAAQLLLTHAREMEAASRATIQSVAGAGVPGIVPALAQQANELILAMQGLGPEAGVPGR